MRRWLFASASIKVSATQTSSHPVFPEASMKRFKLALLVLSAIGMLSMSLNASRWTAHAQKNGDGGGGSPIVYPTTKTVDVVDDYFGTKVPDPYRWLEDDRSPEVAAWVEAENKVTYAYLDQIPYRPAIKDRLMKLYNYPKYGAPTRRGEWFFSTKNDGLQNQSVWYIQKGLDGSPEVILDPNKFSTDGTSRLGSLTISHSGKYIGYGISEGGSDWNEIHVLDVAAKKTLPDRLQWNKFSGASWRGDEGFYYNRYPEPEKGKEMTTRNEFQ